MSGAALAISDPQVEGWVLWIAVVACITVALLLVSMLRRRFLKPMPHEPSDTTDAWVEAGRRMTVPPPDGKNPESDPDEEQP